MADGRTNAETATVVVHDDRSFTCEARFIADMTPIAAQAMAKRGDDDVKVAHATHAVPAQEKTKCEQEETKRAWISSLCSIALCGMGLAVLYVVVDVASSHLSGKDLGYVLAAVVGAPVLTYGVYRFTKPKPAAIQPSSQ